MTSSNFPPTEAVPRQPLTASIRVYLTALDSEFSEAMAALLGHQAGISVVGTSDSLEETLATLRVNDVDVLVLDILVGEGASFEAIHEIKQLRPRIKVLVATGGGLEDQQVGSILAGANGFLYKPLDLVKAIRLLHEGKAFFDAAALVESLAPPPTIQVARSESLTEEDQVFLDLVQKGMSNAQIAKQLHTEIKAVYQRRFRLKVKLGLRSARDLMRVASAAPYKRILVVDDEPMVRQSVKMILKSAGHTVETAVDAAEALTKIEEGKFDLIVSDLRLPGMQGDQLAREIKSRDPSQRVILLTGFPPALCPPDCDLMLLKPFSVVELRKAVAT